MKILQLVSSLKIGGMERFVLDLSQELGKRNEVILGTLYPEERDQLSVENPTFRRVAFDRHDGVDFRLFAKIAGLIRRERPDIVHTHMMPLLYAAPMIFFGKRSTRYVHTVHNVADHEINEIDPLKRLLYGKRVTVVSISEEVRDSVRSYWHGIDTPLIENGAELPVADKKKEQEIRAQLSRFRVTEKTRIVVNVAHISDSKNQCLLNQVAARLRQEGFDVVFLVVGRIGDPAYYEELRKNKAENLFFMGESDAIGAYLKSCDFFCLSSRYEGLPISLLEAMGHGCIPVCTPAGGIPSIIADSQNGFVSDECSLESLLKSFRTALSLSEDRYREVREQSQKIFAEHFSMPRCAENYNALYHKLKSPIL